MSLLNYHNTIHLYEVFLECNVQTWFLTITVTEHFHANNLTAMSKTVSSISRLFQNVTKLLICGKALSNISKEVKQT